MLCDAQHHGKEDSGEVVLVGAWRVSDGPVLTAEPIARRPTRVVGLGMGLTPQVGSSEPTLCG